MTQKDTFSRWHDYIAVSTTVIAVLAAVSSLRAGSMASLLLLEKNNSNLYQSQANKEWNHYLASEITSRVLQKSPNTAEQQRFQAEAERFETQAESSTKKASVYFENSSHLATAGTFLEAGIALSAMAVLLRQKKIWIFSLLLAGVGAFFLIVGFL